MTEAEPATVRADARRNRSRVLAAAIEVFAEHGIAAPLDEIARRAGVGAGTVYRHFPTKEALFEAVVVERIDHLTDQLREAAAADDPGTAFFEALPRVIAQAVSNKALCDAIGLSRDSAESETCHRRFRRHLGELLRRAQATGAVRRELDPHDLHAMLAGCVAMEAFRRSSRAPGSSPTASTATRAPARVGRPVTMIVESLRASGRVTEPRNEIERNETGESSAVCAMCGRPVAVARTGRPATYCGAACRQKAHRQRRRGS